MGNRGLRASNRTPFRTVQKRKASPAQQVRIWARHTFTGEFDKRAVYPVLAIFLIILGLGALVLGSGPLFHSYTHAYVTPPTPKANDPFTYLWETTLSTCQASGSSAEFNQNNTACNAQGSGGCPTSGAPQQCLTMTPNQGFPVIAYTKTPVDLSTVAGKELATEFLFTIGVSTSATVLDVYFTSNNTISSSKTYDPINDANVAGIIQWDSRGGAGNTATVVVFQRLKVGDTINTENVGCSSTQGSCLGEFTTPECITPTPGNANVNLMEEAQNFTGSAGAGAGFSTGEKVVTCGVSAAQVNLSNHFPQFSLSGPNGYFIGFWENTNGVVVNFESANAGCGLPIPSATFIDCMSIANAVPFVPPQGLQGPEPTIDTGGFFGPIIRALIAIGVFIASNIISFLNFLYNIIAPLLSGAATIIGNVLVGVMNALGTIFGDSTLGTQINTAFSNIVSYLTNVFASAVSIWSNILTGLLNLLNFVVNFLTVTVSGGTTLFNFVESFFLTMQNFWSVLVGVWNQFMKWYIAGTFTIQYILVGWWIWGMYENFNLGLKEGLIESWLQPSETFLLAMYKAGYYFLDEAYKFVVQLKQLIFGNRISPGTIAGNG